MSLQDGPGEGRTAQVSARQAALETPRLCLQMQAQAAPAGPEQALS